jgi:hypothetical protein
MLVASPGMAGAQTKRLVRDQGDGLAQDIVDQMGGRERNPRTGPYERAAVDRASVSTRTATRLSNFYWCAG